MDSVPAEMDFEQRWLYCALLRQGKAGQSLGRGRTESHKAAGGEGFGGVWEQGSFQHGIYRIPRCSAVASAPLWDSDRENHPKLSGTDRATDSRCLCGMQSQAGRGYGSETHLLVGHKPAGIRVQSNGTHLV